MWAPLLSFRTTFQNNNRSSLHADTVFPKIPVAEWATDHESVESISRPRATHNERSAARLATSQNL
jgi:hypothetical protein